MKLLWLVIQLVGRWTRFAFLYPDRITHLVTVNQVGLTDRRAGRGFRPLSGEIESNPDMDEVYGSLLRWAEENYSTWQPSFIKHMRIRYGHRLSGDWPRLAPVSYTHLPLPTILLV